MPAEIRKIKPERKASFQKVFFWLYVVGLVVDVDDHVYSFVCLFNSPWLPFHKNTPFHGHASQNPPRNILMRFAKVPLLRVQKHKMYFRVPDILYENEVVSDLPPGRHRVRSQPRFSPPMAGLRDMVYKIRKTPARRNAQDFSRSLPDMSDHQARRACLYLACYRPRQRKYNPFLHRDAAPLKNL